MKWIFLTLAIFGYILNIKNYKFWSYTVWLLSNSCWMVYNYLQNEFELAIMFAIYNVFSIYGIINCRLERKRLKHSKE